MWSLSSDVGNADTEQSSSASDQCVTGNADAEMERCLPDQVSEDADAEMERCLPDQVSDDPSADDCFGFEGEVSDDDDEEHEEPASQKETQNLWLERHCAASVMSSSHPNASSSSAAVGMFYV